MTEHFRLNIKSKNGLDYTQWWADTLGMTKEDFIAKFIDYDYDLFDEDVQIGTNYHEA